MDAITANFNANSNVQIAFMENVISVIIQLVIILV